MTDEEYAAQKARVEALIEKWAAPLGIKWWDVKYEWHRLRHKESPDCAAEMHTTWQYLKAVGEWFLPEIAEMDDAEVEKAVVHEHVHILLAEMAGDKQCSDAEERVCSLVTQAFIWTHQAGIQEGNGFMPGKKHLPGATAKQNRQYEHIKESALKAGKPLAQAKSIAAATVNKGRKK